MKYLHIKTVMTVIVRLQVVYEAVAIDVDGSQSFVYEE